MSADVTNLEDARAQKQNLESLLERAGEYLAKPDPFTDTDIANAARARSSPWG